MFWEKVVEKYDVLGMGKVIPLFGPKPDFKGQKPSRPFVEKVFDEILDKNEKNLERMRTEREQQNEKVLRQYRMKHGRGGGGGGVEPAPKPEERLPDWLDPAEWKYRNGTWWPTDEKSRELHNRVAEELAEEGYEVAGGDSYLDIWSKDRTKGFVEIYGDWMLGGNDRLVTVYTWSAGTEGEEDDRDYDIEMYIHDDGFVEGVGNLVRALEDTFDFEVAEEQKILQEFVRELEEGKIDDWDDVQELAKAYAEEHPELEFLYKFLLQSIMG